MLFRRSPALSCSVAASAAESAADSRKPASSRSVLAASSAPGSAAATAAACRAWRATTSTLNLIRKRRKPIRDGAVAEPRRVVQCFGFDGVLSGLVCIVGREQCQFDSTALHPLGGGEPRLGNRPLRPVHCDRRACVFGRVGQHSFGVILATDRGIGPGQQQPCRQPPGQRVLGGKRRQCLLYRRDDLGEVPAVRGDQPGCDLRDRPREKLSGRREAGVIGRPLVGQIQLARVRQGEHVAVPHHDPDHPVRGLLLRAASGRDRFEVVAAPCGGHGQSRTESRKLDCLIWRARISQHRFRCRDTFRNPVLVHRHC